MQDLNPIFSINQRNKFADFGGRSDAQIKKKPAACFYHLLHATGCVFWLCCFLTDYPSIIMVLCSGSFCDSFFGMHRRKTPSSNFAFTSSSVIASPT